MFCFVKQQTATVGLTFEVSQCLFACKTSFEGGRLNILVLRSAEEQLQIVMMV
jgi:hypothetical protein